MIPSLVDTSLDFGLFRVVRPHGVSYGNILEKNDCDVPSHPQNGVNRNINILSTAVPYGHNPNMGWTETNKYI